MNFAWGCIIYLKCIVVKFFHNLIIVTPMKAKRSGNHWLRGSLRSGCTKLS